MEKKVKLTIDGREVAAPAGTNLIDAAELAGVHIPNLCFLKGMKGIGACRLCMVEVEGLKAPMVGCTTRVKEGMVVNTKTEKIEEMRKFVIDLILSMHPLDCMTCTKAGVCNLQQYAYDFEIKESSFTRKKFGFSIDEANPFIKRDPDYCVLCGRCVRVCKNQGTNVLEFMGRGVGSKVTTANDRPLQESGCTFCGSCVDACPVNALLEADRWRKGREWEYERTDSVCLLCGSGCDITVCTKDGAVAKIVTSGKPAPVEQYICAYGRFGFDSLEGDSRVTRPMKRVGGELVETSWKDALEIAAEALKKAGNNAGFISTGGILNEDALALKNFAGTVVKTKNVDTTVSLYADTETLLSQAGDLETADLIVLVGVSPSQWKRTLPALDAVIRRRVESGTKLVVVSAGDSPLSQVASVSLAGDEPATLRSLAKAMLDKGAKGNRQLEQAVSGAEVSEAVATAADMMMEAKSPLVLAAPSLYRAAGNIGLMKGTVVAVPLESNAKGVLMMGLAPGGKGYGEMTSGRTDLLYAVGEVPVRERPDTGFLIVQGSYMGDLARQADLVLPAAAYLESEGTMVDYLGRVKKAARVVGPFGEARQHREIFAGIAKAMGAKMSAAKETEAKKLSKAKVKPSFSPFERSGVGEADPQEMMEALNEAVIRGSRLQWLSEAEKAIA